MYTEAEISAPCVVPRSAWVSSIYCYFVNYKHLNLIDKYTDLNWFEETRKKEKNK